MPAKKGSHLKNGDRNYIFDRRFFNKYGKNLGFTQGEASDVIRVSNSIIADIVVEEYDGFKLPNGLGYLVASKFKPKHPAINWRETAKYKKLVYHLNLHSFGYSVGVFWFRVGRITHASLNEVLKFASWTSLARAVSKKFREGKNYREWSISDFMELGRLERLYSKRYRKELKQ